MLWHATGLGSPAFMVPEAQAQGMKVIGMVGSVRQARRRWRQAWISLWLTAMRLEAINVEDSTSHVFVNRRVGSKPTAG